MNDGDVLKDKLSDFDSGVELPRPDRSALVDTTLTSPHLETSGTTTETLAEWGPHRRDEMRSDPNSYRPPIAAAATALALDAVSAVVRAAITDRPCSGTVSNVVTHRGKCISP